MLSNGDFTYILLVYSGVISLLRGNLGNRCASVTTLTPTSSGISKARESKGYLVISDFFSELNGFPKPPFDNFRQVARTL